MSLIEYTLEGKINRVDIAIERLKSFEPPEGYYLAFSGGKDSITIYELAKMSGVKFDTHFNFTTVDPPELLQFIRENYPDVIWHRPKKTMWRLIEHKRYPPTRIVRYCCSELKERGGSGRFVVLGVRRSESVARKNRPIVDYCYKNHQKHLHPIIDWIDKDVWDFIRQQNLKYCCLYDEGYKRIGCVMCPMQGTMGMLKDKKRYPNFAKAYLKAFKKMLKRNREDNIGMAKDNDINEMDVMNLWISGHFKIDNAIKLFEEEQIFNYE